MLSFEFLILIISFTQPLIVGLLAFIGFGRVLNFCGVNGSLSSLRSRVSSVRFYECATNSRSGGYFQYSLNMINIVCAYLIYDVDLVLLLSEVLFFCDYGFVEFLLLFIFIIFFIIGLRFDYKTIGYGWSLK